MKRPMPVLFSLVVGLALSATGAVAEIASAWVAGYNVKARLIAGQASAKAGAPASTYAGLDLVLQPGWKTYWRMPGDAGGLAPSFSFEGSKNLAEAEVLYPVPMRLPDPAGVSIGYKDAVTFPIRIVPLKRGEPVDLKLSAEYGICREICVPAEAKLSLTIPTSGLPAATSVLQSALAAVPTRAGAARPGDPSLVAARFDAARPDRLLFDVGFPSGGSGADLFVEAPEGIYLPLASAVGETRPGVVTFALDMADGIDVKEILGKRLVLTMVGGGRQAEATWDVPAAAPR